MHLKELQRMRWISMSYMEPLPRDTIKSYSLKVKENALCYDLLKQTKTEKKIREEDIYL